jgi:hypothetical protein
MAVDMAARIVHFQVQAKDNWQKVHDFMVRYSDRLLYATDKMATVKSNPQQEMESFHETWINDWEFFTSEDSMSSVEFNGSFKGLHLPRYVIDRIYRENAQKWLKIFPTN